VGWAPWLFIIGDTCSGTYVQLHSYLLHCGETLTLCYADSVWQNFHTSDTFSPQKPNYCMLLFGTCGKESGLADGASGARQLNDQGQVHHYKNKEIPCLLFHMHSSLQVMKKINNMADSFQLYSHR
jgi:hypothetical protein